MDVDAIEREMDELLGTSDEVRLMQELNKEIDCIPGYSYQDKINYLTNCNCCDRHQLNKPTTYVPWYDCESNKMMWQETFVQCECDCRHMSRMICRLCTDEFDPVQKTMLGNSDTPDIENAM